MNHDVLDDIKGFIKNGRLLMAWIGGIAASTSLVALLSALGPPWPTTKGVAYLTALTEICVSIYCFLFYLQSSGGMGIDRIQRRVRLGMIGIIVFVLCYMVAYAFLFLDLGEDGTEAKGWIYTSQAVGFLEGNPGASDVELVRDAGGDVMKVFVPWTVAVARLILLVLWVFAFGSIAYCMTAFLSTQYRRTAMRDKQEAKKTKVTPSPVDG